MKKLRWRWLGVFSLGLLLVAAAFAHARLAPQAEVGAGFVATQTCSCLFVAGRDLAACRLDLRPELGRVRLQAEAASVRAWVPLFGSRVARHREGSGCTLE